MKKLKQIVEDIKLLDGNDPEQLQALLWKLICYSPKMPGRVHQQELTDRAEKDQLKVYDEYFSQSDLSFNTFRWGKGPVKVLLTHGWGSKAIDFSELIHALLQNPDIEVRAFDAPGNGSSEGELSNLILFADAVKQMQKTFGMPDVMIGHSLGGMANALVVDQTTQYPEVLISIAPLVNLTENFRTTMTAVGITEAAQQHFFKSFEDLYGINTDRFLLNDMYSFAGKLKHLLLYELNDYISPADYIHAFLQEHPEIRVSQYIDTSHAKIIVDPRVIAEIGQFIKIHLD
ncbi:MAG TPA: alpha/beta hydrolase [Pedobacter sp.]|uniref:alpha/beta hydrolase n=1 Tax=Pedobacter sp. TaxID=1411316 RepID=UPI002C6A8C85|nr:alpha/beta hydrolase [Pedobacter sp.]HMI02613.1 alpha/beta hydrolase [Pedobacter sp.]